jgi:hypothetical protein
MPMRKAPFLFKEMLTSAIMRKETAIHILKADFINRPNLFVNGCADYPINYLPSNAPMIRNRTGLR